MPGTPPTTPRHAIPRIATTDTDDVPRDLNAVADRIDVTAPVFISGLASARPAAGIADRYHFATDTGELTRDTGSAWSTPLNPRSIATVTSLPGSPYDGQIIDYLADATNRVLWRLRYQAASASAYKWEFLGGSHLRASVAAAETVGTGGAWTNLITAGPDITVPLAGEYEGHFGARVSITNVPSNAYLGLASGNGTPPGLVAQAGAINATGLTGTQAQTLHMRDVYTFAAAAIARVRYQADLSTGTTFRDRWLRLWPVRVG